MPPRRAASTVRRERSKVRIFEQQENPSADPQFASANDPADHTLGGARIQNDGLLITCLIGSAGRVTH
jgi:hypothetical protein